MKKGHRSELLSFLKTNDLFKDLSENELTSLLPYLQIVNYDRSDWIIEEGDYTHHLILIREGRAEVIKGEQTIGFLEPGDWAGEMAHLEKERRSASIRAFDEVQAVIFFLEEFSNSPAHREIYEKLIPKLTKKVSERLRKTGNDFIALLKEKLELTQSSNQISKTIIYTMILFALFFNFVTAYDDYAGNLRNTFNLIFMPFSILLFGAGAVRLIQKSGYPLSFYGVTWDRWFRVAVEGFVVTLPILGLMSLMKWAAITNIPSLQGTPFIAITRPDQSWDAFVFGSVVYILLAPVQEFVVRGVLQSSFRNFFQGHNRVFYAILASNLLFEVLHTSNNLFLAIFSFIFGIFWGALYEYQKSIIGATISHIMVGWWALFMLDLLSLAPAATG